MKEEKWDREFNKIFQNELGTINEKPPVDDKDRFAREQMILAIPRSTFRVLVE